MERVDKILKAENPIKEPVNPLPLHGMNDRIEFVPGLGVFDFLPESFTGKGKEHLCTGLVGPVYKVGYDGGIFVFGILVCGDELLPDFFEGLPEVYVFPVGGGHQVYVIEPAEIDLPDVFGTVQINLFSFLQKLYPYILSDASSCRHFLHIL